MKSFADLAPKMREIIARGRAVAAEREAAGELPPDAAPAQVRPSTRGLPSRYADTITGADFDPSRPAVVAVRDFIASARPLLILAGSVGVGKSVAAAWGCANFRPGTETVAWKHGDPYGELERGEAQISKPASTRFVLAYKLIQAGTFDKDFWREVETPALLVLDELGSEPQDAKGMGVTNLTNLLTHRHAHNLKTIVTTNAPRDAFVHAYCTGPGLRTLDRIREYPGQVFLELEGESMRGIPITRYAPYTEPREPGDDG